MTEISALVGLANLEDFGAVLKHRQQVAKQYEQAFSDPGKCSLMRVSPNVSCTFLYYPLVLLRDAGEFVEAMAKRNVAVRRYYTAVHELSYYKSRYTACNLEMTESLMDKIVALPVHNDMTEAEIRYVISTTLSVLDELS